MKTGLRKCVITSCIALSTVSVCGKVWLGIGAVAAAHGASWQDGAVIGLLGISDSTLYGAAMIAMGASGPACLVVGAAVGL